MNKKKYLNNSKSCSMRQETNYCVRNFFTILMVLFFSNVILAQDIKLSEKELETALDSILKEGNLLYKYEKSAWISTDLASNTPILNNRGGYFTYEIDSKIKTIILGKNQNCIAEYIFTTDFDEPDSILLDERDFNPIEDKLLKIREKIIKQLSDKKYNVRIPNGYSPNFILLPFREGYKLYMIMGTSQSDVIPFGNDYLFIADKNGKIKKWQKFHSGLIFAPTTYKGAEVTSHSHSHLRTTPLITATDICTFMLYAPFTEMEEFSVYSPALGMYMTYNLKTNEITTKKSEN